MTSGIDEHPQGAIRGHRHRLWLFAPLFLLLLVAVGTGALWHWRLSLAERAFAGAVGSAGIEFVGVSVDRLDFTGAALSDLRFGPSGSQHIAGARLTWSVWELLDRRLRAIEISGASLHAAIGPDGKLALDGVSPPGRADRATGGLVFPAGLPFKRIDVEQVRVAVALPDGQADVVVDGHLEVSADTLAGEISTRYSAETKRGRGTGTGSASVTWAETTAPRGEFELEFERLVTANATVTNLRLSGGTDGVPARLEDMSFRAEGFAEVIQVPQLAVRDVGLTAELSGGILDLRGDGKLLDWAVEMSTRLQPFDLTVPAEFGFSARGGAATVSERMATVSAAGDVAIMVDAEINNPAALFAARDTIIQQPAVMADHVAARLNLEANLQRFALFDMLHTGPIAAHLSARWNDGMLDVDIGEPSHVDAVTLAPNLEKKLAAWIPGGSPFNVAVTEGMGSPATVRLSWTDGRLKAQAVGGLDVALPEGTIELEVDGSASATLSGGVERFDIAALRAAVVAVPTPYGSVSGDVLVTGLLADGANLSGAVGGEIAVSAASNRSVSARQVTLNIDGAFRATPDEVSVALSPGGWVTARDVRLAGGYALPGTSRLHLADGRHRLALNRRKGGVSVDVRLRPGKAKLHVAPRVLGIAYGAVAVSGTWPGSLVIDAEDVSTGLGTDRRVGLAGLRVRADGKSSDAVVAITVKGAEPALPGLTLPSFDASAKIVRRGPSLVGELEVIATAGQPSLRARGQHSLKTGKGKGEIVEARLRFAPGVLQPGDINPAIAGTIENVFATISLQGPIAWDGTGALTPNLVLTIAELAAATDDFELFDAHATVLLSGLPALETPPGQRFSGQVRVGRLDPVPLDVSFQLLPGLSGSGPRLVIEHLAAKLAEGRLTTDRFMLTPPSIDTDVTLRLEGADLARAFAVIGVAGIGGTGRISGEIPVIVRGNQVAISGGRLVNNGPGEVFYDIAALPPSLIERDDTVTLVLEALSNFAFDELQVDMDKALDGPGRLRMRLAGANPDVLENHPFIFNINLDSNFDRLAALVLDGLTTSQGLLRALALSPANSRASEALP